jgi:RHS repeat-associated protein
MVTYNGTNYYYQNNLQGDIIKLMDMAGSTVVSYTYDSWGKQLSCTGSLANTLGVANPLRYRSYIFDEETGLYYLQSRYYNPVFGRFINTDTNLGSTNNILSNNPYSYCHNTPVNFVDSSGKDPGDPFTSEDDAADDCMKYIGQQSIDERVEYYSVIFEYQDNGNVMYSDVDPISGGGRSSSGVICIFRSIPGSSAELLQNKQNQ